MSFTADEMVLHEVASDVEDDDDKEDAWLALEVAKLEADEAATPRDVDAYRPQLMDVPVMQSLRRELRTSEARVERDGRLREFVPRKPALSVRPQTHSHGRRPRLDRRRVFERPMTSTDHGEVTDDNQGTHADPFPVQERLKREYATALHDEVEQLNELFDQYDDTKRMLLDHLDLICSAKPTERTNSHEVYAKLDELLAFAAKCTLPKTK